MRGRVIKTEIKLEDYEHFLGNPYDDAFSYQQLNKVTILFHFHFDFQFHFLLCSRPFGTREKKIMRLTKKICSYSFPFVFLFGSITNLRKK